MSTHWKRTITFFCNLNNLLEDVGIIQQSVVPSKCCRISLTSGPATVGSFFSVGFKTFMFNIR